MIAFGSHLILYIQRLSIVIISILSSYAFLLGAATFQDVTHGYDVAEISNEPVFLYDHLQVYKTSDTTQSSLSQSVTNTNFEDNNTIDDYDAHDNYYVRLNLKNSSTETHDVLLNLSPNNWNQSWDKIQVKVYRDNQLISDISTGYNYNIKDKPVSSIMNLLDLRLLPHDQIHLQIHLGGINYVDANSPRHIDFVLLKESQTVGLRSYYPFNGVFIDRKSHSTFRANHLINHEIYLDKSKSKSIQEIDEAWESLELSNIFNTSYNENGAYWLKTKLIGTPQFNGKQIFQVSNAPNWSEGTYSPVADNFSFDYIDGYYKDKHEHNNHERTGYKVRTSQRPLDFWANFLTVDIAIGDTIDYYIRLEGGSRRQHMTSLVLYHVAPLSIFPKQVKEGWSHGLYFGALGIYLFFFTLLYLVEREPLYLYFSLSILGLLMINIFPEDIFSRFVALPTWRHLHIPLYFLGTFIQFFGFLKFTENFFLIDKSSIIARIIIPTHITILGLAALYCAINFEYIPILGNPLFEPYMLIFLFLQLISIILPITIAIIAKKKIGVSKISYFLSFVPVVIAGLYHFGNLFLPNFFNIEGFQSTAEVDQSFNYIQLGVATMLTLFAMNVGFRANRLKSEKEKATILAEKNVIIEAKSKQNETLLKEIHHRVKNNLQTISSLLYLQSYGEKNKQTKENIAITQQRVESMALIHKNLYQRDNLASIEMKDYIQNLCDSLISAYQTRDKKVKLEMDMPILELDIDRAIPMGLIINEIVTNSLKHAFPPNYNAVISISFTTVGDSHTLIIKDNGVGKSSESAPSFGTKLIKLLTKQINANADTGNDKGFYTKITWSDEA